MSARRSTSRRRRFRVSREGQRARVPLGLLLGGLLFVAAAALVGMTWADLEPVPETLPPPIAEASIVRLVARDGTPLSYTYQNAWNVHDVVPLHAVPELLRNAFIAAEDQRFYRHRGVDWIARGHALVQNLLAFRAVRGASTITEQVVRILHPRPRTLWSRWLEGIEAGRLERRFSKAHILEFYLNQVPYARQRRGISQAARDTFDRDLDTLSVPEMLALAVLVRSPSRMDLIRGSEAIQAPLTQLARRLSAAGLLDQDVLEVVEREPPRVRRSGIPLEASHFVRFVRDKTTERDARGVTTTLDASLQKKVQFLLDAQVKRLSSREVRDGAALIVDHQRDEILAWVNAGGFSDREGGQIDKITMRRQPGSALKPFVYALALEHGWTAATLIDDSPLAVAVGHGLHPYRNYSRHYYGPVRLREALGNSLNIPAVLATQFIGRTELLERLRLLGFSSLDRHPDFYGDGIALGNGEVTLFEMVCAYATLARGGMARPLAWRLDGRPRERNEVFSAEVASIVADILSDPEARRLEFGASSVLSLPVQTAVKTGTSNDYRDAWALGFSHRYTVGVWMGNVDRRPMREVTGSFGPALVLRSIFAELHRTGRTKPLFLSRTLTRREICVDTGKRATRFCPTTHEWFRPGHVPSETCSEHEVGKKTTMFSESVSTPGWIRIQRPHPGLHLALDPRIPDELERFRFEVSAPSDVRQIEWIVDERVVGTTDGDSSSLRSFLWQPVRGAHEVRARLWLARHASPMETELVRFNVK